jgi:hypothetical protein
MLAQRIRCLLADAGGNLGIGVTLAGRAGKISLAVHNTYLSRMVVIQIVAVFKCGMGLAVASPG